MLQYLGESRFDLVLVEDSSLAGKVRRLIERSWPNILKWLKYLLANAEHIGVGGFDHAIITQSAIGYICTFLRDMCQFGIFTDKVIDDPFIFDIAVLAFLTQDVRVLSAMEKLSRSPALLLSRFLAHRQLPPNADEQTKDSLRSFLGGLERPIVKCAFQHLRYAQTRSRDATTSFDTISV